MKNIRSYIREVLKENLNTHKCLGGKHVPIESIECYDDICIRIDDAVETRNTYPLQSDSRSHYNGLLKVLRRKKHKAKKFMDAGA